MPHEKNKVLYEKPLRIKLMDARDGRSNRRQLLMQILRVSGQVTLASGAIYSMSLLTSRQGISAGAK